MWDGLGFFTMDETKLDRLKGKQVDYLTKFKSKKWIITNTLLAIFVVVILN